VAIASSLSSLVIGNEQLTMTLPDTLPACFRTSSTRDQCTARRIASASRTASDGVPALARSPACRASRFSFCSLCE